MKSTINILIRGGLLAILLLTSGCSNEPSKIYYGEDECAHCRMIITDARFASELVTETGKAYKFDAIECMAAFLSQHEDLNVKTSKLWVHDFSNPDKWLSRDEAQFVHSEEIRSPMGLSLLALPNKDAVQQHLNRHPGDTVGWSRIMEMVHQEWD